MSDPTHDPIRDLENFGTGGIAVNPLEPAQVRRLGDQRRARRRNTAMAIAAVAVAAAVIPTAVLANRDGGTPAPFVDTPTPTPTPSVINFPGDGVHVTKVADVTLLEGTSEEFKAFMVTVLHKDSETCDNADVTVKKYSSDGFGLGGVGGCGGYQAVWVLKDGTWIEALGTQDEWVCSDLARYDVPDGFAGDCYVPDPPPAVITFPSQGQAVHQESDAAKLQGTTDDFKEFIIGKVADLQADAAKEAAKHPADCSDPSAAGIRVRRFAQAGYAVGSVFLCPTGYAAIWKKVDGTWKEVLISQEQWTCSDMDRVGIPHTFVDGGCYDPNLVFGPDSVDGFSIGMTAAQVQAAGGIIEGDPAGDCALVTKPEVIAAKNAPLKEVAMTRGKVIAIFAGQNVPTPEGISIGSSEEQVKAAYPDGRYDIHNYWHVKINADSEYEIGVNTDKRVFELLIQTTGEQRCYG